MKSKIKVFDTFLYTKPGINSAFTDSVKNQLINVWHELKRWPEITEAVKKLKKERYLETFDHSNRGTR